MLIVTFDDKGPTSFLPLRAKLFKPRVIDGIVTLPFSKEAFFTLKAEKQQVCLEKIRSLDTAILYPEPLEQPRQDEALFDMLMADVLKKAICYQNLSFESILIATDSAACEPLLKACTAFCKIVKLAGPTEVTEPLSERLYNETGTCIPFFELQTPVQADIVLSYHQAPCVEGPVKLCIGYSRPAFSAKTMLTADSVWIRPPQKYDYFCRLLGRRLTLSDCHLIMEHLCGPAYTLRDIYHKKFGVSVKC